MSLVSAEHLLEAELALPHETRLRSLSRSIASLILQNKHMAISRLDPE